MIKLTVADIKEQRLKTLGIPKSHKCPHCGKRQELNDIDRFYLAESIQANFAGMWALLHCGRCGWVDKIYPTRINGVECTKQECDKLQEEMERYVNE